MYAVLRTLTLGCILLLAGGAAAALSHAPVNPSPSDVITARLDITAGCNVSVDTTVAGNVIRSDVFQTGCTIGPPPVVVPWFFDFGPLPAGTYRHDVYLHYETDPAVLEAQQVIVVAASIAPVPALDGTSLAVLAVALAACAVLVQQRSA